MSEPTDEPAPSLIQQRIALQRRKAWAIAFTVFWTLSATWWLSSGLLTDSRDLDVMRVVLGVLNLLLAVAQVFMFRRAVRDERNFEARNGTNAGRR